MFNITRPRSMMAGLCLLLFSCGGTLPSEPGEFDLALRKMPLPPGPQEVRVTGKDRNDFFVQAEFPDKAVGTISDFYLDFFKENGWTINAPPEGVDVSTTLYYKKDKAETFVQISNAKPGAQVFISYVEREFSLEEFDQVVRDTASPEARALVNQIKQAYGNLVSYADTGTFEFNSGGKITSRSTFKTAYRDPGDFLFEQWDTQVDTYFSASVVGKMGDVVQIMSDTDKEPTVEPDVVKAVSTIYSVTACNVPALLLDSDPDWNFKLSGLSILEEASIDDGTPCLLLQGKDYRDRESTIWIGKEDLLFRKFENIDYMGNHSTTTYSPLANIEIAEEELTFKKPVAREGL